MPAKLRQEVKPSLHLCEVRIFIVSLKTRSIAERNGAERSGAGSTHMGTGV